MKFSRTESRRNRKPEQTDYNNKIEAVIKKLPSPGPECFTVKFYETFKNRNLSFADY